MKIVSLNLHCKQEPNLESINQRIAKYIEDNLIDVCLLQEVAQERVLQPTNEKANETNQGLQIYNLLKGYYFAYEPVKVGFGLDEGLAIISKHKLQDVSLTYISNLRDYNNWSCRAYLEAHINTLEGDYIFINTHLCFDESGESHQEQFDRMYNNIKDKDSLVIIGGDMNMTYNSSNAHHVKKYLYMANELADIDPVVNRTFLDFLDYPNADNNQMIDYFLINKKILIKSFIRAFYEEQKRVSDHCLIQIEI